MSNCHKLRRLKHCSSFNPFVGFQLSEIFIRMHGTDLLSPRSRSYIKCFVLALWVLLCSASLWPQENGQRPNWDPDKFGNHRFVLHVKTPTNAVWAHVEWRRRDHQPEEKDLLVVDAKTGTAITNIYRVRIDREAGDILFQPVSGPGDYYVYYLPYVGTPRSSYPKVSYPTPKQTAEAAWLSGIGVESGTNELPRRRDDFPSAEVVGYESVDDLNRFTDMERIATSAEIAHLLEQNPGRNYFVFPEDRSNPIRMRWDIPQRWVLQGPQGLVRADTKRGEYYSFQLGVWAARSDLSDVKVAFSDLKGTHSNVSISARAMHCINQGGVDHEGNPFIIRVDVPQRAIQPFWCGVDVPVEAQADQYNGEITVSAKGRDSTHLKLAVDVFNETIRNHGDDVPQQLSRLRWLDSTLDQDDGIVPPYTPIVAKGQSFSILGRTLEIRNDGLPAAIKAYFDDRMTGMVKRPRELLARPMSLIIVDGNGHTIPWVTSKPHLLKKTEGRVTWETVNSAGPLEIRVHAELEFDGNVKYSVAVKALRETNLQDIHLEIPFRDDVARYVMGLGLKGGSRPERFDWKWDVKHNQDGAWIGDVNAGLQFGLQDDRYSRPLNTNFYLSKPLVMPASWDNSGRGGCSFRHQSTTYLVTCGSGQRKMAADEVQHYDFRLLLTPFHTINPLKQWNTRFYHAFKPLDEVAAAGANTINVHHGTAINPFINYPFLRAKEMKQYVDDAHARGMKVKIYYTIRELTNHAPEIFALRSLGHEVLAPGKGGGGPWLQEHLEDDYITGWHVPEFDDSAIVTTGISRWHNFYVEGLHWLVENVGIDGLYLDDVAFDRVTMKRVRKVLARGRPDPMIDLHSANQFDANDGFASSANLYLEHFPYIDRLWFGEYFDYNSPPDYWLIEMSGIPFGLMGEMLQDGGNPWRGMVYGMTDRLPYSGDPRPLWHLWDSFGIQNTQMIGYWVPDSPVKTDRADVLATVYQGKNHSLLAIASWAPTAVDVKLKINWQKLGIDPTHARVIAPAVRDFQEARDFGIDQPIPIVPGKGWLIEISQAAGKN
jgi:Family of unknown function (DUF6067)